MKLIPNNIRERLTKRSLMLALTVALTVLGLSAEEYSGPAITGFYPAVSDPVQVLKPNASAYVYFAAGSKVLRAKGLVSQYGQSLGSCVYKNSNPNGGTNATMNYKDADNAFMQDLLPGLFTITIYEVTWKDADGNELTYSDINANLASVTYRRPDVNGSIISETGFEDKLVKSYYPLESTEGVKTLTFSKAVVPDMIHAYFEYGYGENMLETSLPHSLSADGTQLTIDLRGTCYNVDALAPGVTFYDPSGNPLEPPTTITMHITGLNCVDGTKIGIMLYSPDGSTSYYSEGKALYNYNYQDITLPTPVLEKAEFYAAANPTKRYLNINATTDMMDLFVANTESITTADMLLTAADVEETIPYASIQKGDGVFTVALPAAIKAAGSDNLVISLINEEYSAIDGVEHRILPLDLASVAKEKSSVAEVKNCPIGSEVVLLATDLKVTLSDAGTGYTFVEDESGAMQVMLQTVGTVAFPQGKLVSGRIAGTYASKDMFVVNLDESDFTTTDADISEGTVVSSLESLLTGDYNCRLVAIATGSDISLTMDAGSMIMADNKGNMAVVITDLAPAFTWPAEVTSITGVYVLDPSIGTPMILVRTQDDINRTLTNETESFAEVKALEPGTQVRINIDNALVTFVGEYGPVILEYNGSALCLESEDDDLIFVQGSAVSGTLVGTYTGESVLLVDMDESLLSATESDVTTGSVISLDEIASDEHHYRLVTFVNNEATPVTADPEGFGLLIGDNVSIVDMWDVLDWDYEFPSKVESVTGIVLPPMGIGIDDLGGTSRVLVALRNADDIKGTQSSGIEVIGGNNVNDGAVYDLRGIKVADSAKALHTLAPGIYVINGKKAMVK